MFWSCVNQSDYKKFYIQFWLWPGLSNVRSFVDRMMGKGGVGEERGRNQRQQISRVPSRLRPYQSGNWQVIRQAYFRPPNSASHYEMTCMYAVTKLSGNTYLSQLWKLLFCGQFSTRQSLDLVAFFLDSQDHPVKPLQDTPLLQSCLCDRQCKAKETLSSLTLSSLRCELFPRNYRALQLFRYKVG